MSQINPLKGAMFMVLAGMAFAAANAVTFQVTAFLGFKSQSDAFWQYAIATLIALPFILRHGIPSMKTRQPWLHLLRVALAAAGVQAFTAAFAAGMPTWHVIALVMTSPFFVLIGAVVFLKEEVSPNRWVAASIGFAGAMVLLRPWEGGLTSVAAYPVIAAICWGAVSLITKRLTREESRASVTMWLLLLLTPINGAWSLQAGFEWPSGEILALLLAGGVLMLAAQHFLTLSYAAADAGFVQPFDDLKLFSNIFVSWLIFGDVPTGTYWLGILLILSGTAWLLWTGRTGRVGAVPA
jgi:drug/metabolite transporter (DMT)-like permease